MNIAYIAKTEDQVVAQLLKENFTGYFYYGTPDDFLKSAGDFDGIIIRRTNDKDKHSFLRTLRRSEKYYLTPVFFEEGKISFSDDSMLNIPDIKGKIEEINILSKEINQVNPGNWENKLLAYLYTRKELIIKPEIDKTHEMFFFYPVISYFYEGDEDYFYWLETLAKQEIFSRIKMVDRLFCCPFCFSAHLKFSDHCPNCGSINIKNEKFLHCFTCGHVAPEANFVKMDRFECPSCHAKLRHIGEDYDRPLENGICMDCGNYHTDSLLKVTCLTCNKTFSTEELNRRSIYEYKLTDIGRNNIKYGTVNITSLLTDELNYVNMEYFNSMLQWLMRMQLRYNEEIFSMLALKIVLNYEYSNYELLLEFAKILRDVVRTTDFCIRLDNETIVLLFPKTDTEGINIISNRVRDAIDNMKIYNNKLSIKSEVFTSSETNIKDKSPETVITQLTSHL